MSWTGVAKRVRRARAVRERFKKWPQARHEWPSRAAVWAQQRCDHHAKKEHEVKEITGERPPPGPASKSGIIARVAEASSPAVWQGTSPPYVSVGFDTVPQFRATPPQLSSGMGVQRAVLVGVLCSLTAHLAMRDPNGNQRFLIRMWRQQCRSEPLTMAIQREPSMSPSRAINGGTMATTSLEQLGFPAQCHP